MVIRSQGMIALQQTLLIFKRSSVWAVYGYDRDTYTLEQIADNSGACSCGAAAVHGGYAYWFSTDGRFWRSDGRRPVDLSAPILWWTELGKFQVGGRHIVRQIDARIWLRLEAGSGEDVDYYTFIWDPFTNTFTRYDKEIADFVWWPRVWVHPAITVLFEQ